ncbi:hypothetical protein WS62_16125 [Burkholderia sp. ABCPW 14]|nr:hypothetical protein WS62_16125 [Burkholderia sp. ABCPW 14]
MSAKDSGATGFAVSKRRHAAFAVLRSRCVGAAFASSAKGVRAIAIDQWGSRLRLRARLAFSFGILTDVFQSDVGIGETKAGSPRRSQSFSAAAEKNKTRRS